MRGVRAVRPGLPAPRLVVAAVSVLALLGLLGCTAAGPSSPAGTTGPLSTLSGSTASGGTTSVDPATDVELAVRRLAAARAAAVAAQDKAAWLATVADPGSSFGAAQASLFDRLVALPVTGLTAGEITVTAPAFAATAPTAPIASHAVGPVSGDGWVANLQLAYRFAGYDQGDRTFRVSYAVMRTADGWRLAGPGAGRTDPQPFDLVDATSLRSPSTLVIGDVPTATLQTYLDLGDAARQRIEQAWGSARPGVLVAPRTTDELQGQLGRGSIAGLQQVAAITDGPLSAGAPAPSDRVYLNPAAFARLSPAGRGVVVTHELTHVTVRATTTRPVPIWLSEGYADQVAYAASGLSQATVAAELFTRVRAGQVPDALPDVQAFDPARGALSPVYNEAWLAVVLLRDTYGATALNAFYRAIAISRPGDPSATASTDERTRTAFGDVLGVTQDAFVADWRAYLVRLAG
ncbi:MAG: hypothetical protein ABIW80_02780 [Lapillicoccus sp.]